MEEQIAAGLLFATIIATGAVARVVSVRFGARAADSLGVGGKESTELPNVVRVVRDDREGEVEYDESRVKLFSKPKDPPKE